MKPKRQKRVTLNLKDVTTEAAFYERMEAVLLDGTDSGNGESWATLRTGMAHKVQMPRQLEVKGWREFQAACPALAKEFLDLIDDYNRDMPRLPCKVIFGDGLSPALFWGPDIFLFALIPVEVLAFVEIVGPFGWKLAIIALFVAIALVTQVIVMTCVLSVMQPRWPMTKGHLWAAGGRMLLSFLLFVGCLAGMVLEINAGVPPEDGFALCAAALALAANTGYHLVLLRKGRFM